MTEFEQRTAYFNFPGKGRCAACHTPQTSFLDYNMHDLKLELFYQIGQTVNDLVMLPDGAIKTFAAEDVTGSIGAQRPAPRQRVGPEAWASGAGQPS